MLMKVTMRDRGRPRCFGGSRYHMHAQGDVEGKLCGLLNWGWRPLAVVSPNAQRRLELALPCSGRRMALPAGKSFALPLPTIPEAHNPRLVRLGGCAGLV
jgi:hypothetical protein